MVIVHVWCTEDLHAEYRDIISLYLVVGGFEQVLELEILAAGITEKEERTYSLFCWLFLPCCQGGRRQRCLGYKTLYSLYFYTSNLSLHI